MTAICTLSRRPLLRSLLLTNNFLPLEYTFSGGYAKNPKLGVVEDKRSPVTYVTRSAVGILLCHTLRRPSSGRLNPRFGMVSAAPHGVFRRFWYDSTYALCMAL